MVKEKEIDEYIRPDEEEINNADADFLPDNGDPKLAALTREMFSTQVGKLRKSVLTRNQAVVLAQAWAFAAMEDVPELAAIADMLADTTVSVGGLGLRQMVKVMTARMEAEDDQGGSRFLRNMGL